jgi:WD40 repeat protein
MKHNPYVGPRPYKREDQENFYGRTREARDLRSLIMAERVVLFYAPSGAGKSSLLNANIIPDLEDEDFNVLPIARVGSALPDGITYDEVENVFVFSVLLTLAQGNEAPKELLHHTLTSFLQASNVTRYKLEAGNSVIPNAGASGDTSSPTDLPDPGRTYLPLLILDQFEELFTTHRGRWQDAKGFFEQVREALDQIPELGVLFAMREDYVAEVEPFAGMLPRRMRGRFRMERLGYRAALEAIKKPAQRQGINFEAGAAEYLADNLRQIKVRRLLPSGQVQEDEVPGPYVEPVQLQVVCYQLWENLPEQEDREIQREEITQYGDIDRALSDFYERALAHAARESGVSERHLRRWFSEQLITQMGTRGLALRGAEETAGLPNIAVDALESHHLIRAEVRAGARWYELAHDRLVDPVLQSNQAWEAARETPLRVTAREWARTENPVLLYKSEELQRAWQAFREKEQRDEAEPYEHEFLEESQRVEDARLEKARLEAKVRARKRRLLIGGGLTGVAVLILVSVLAWTAIQASELTYMIKQSMEARQLSDVNRPLSIERAQEAVEPGSFFKIARTMNRELEATSKEAALREVLLDAYPIAFQRELDDYIESITYSPNGQTLYIGTSASGVLGWHAYRDQPFEIPPPGPGGQGSVRTLTPSPDGRVLAIGGDDGKAWGVVGLWDTEEDAWITRLQIPQPKDVHDEIYSVAYSPHGRYLATGGDYGEHWRDIVSLDRGLIRLWELSTDTSPSDVTSALLKATALITLTSPLGRVQSLAFSPVPERLETSYGSVYGYLLAAGSDDATVRIWHIEPALLGQVNVTPLITFTDHTAGVNAVAFSPTENLLASASSDKTIRLWDLTTGKAIATLIGHGGAVTSLAFEAGGRYLISGSRDRTVRVWDVGARNTEAVILLTGPTNLVQSVAITPDSKFIAAGSGDKTVRVWNLDFPREVALSTLSGHTARVRNIAYSPDGQYLASGDDEGIVHIWSLARGEIAHTLINGNRTIWDVGYSPDGRYLVTCSKDYYVRVWNTAQTRQVKAMYEHTGEVNAVAFSPDGRFMVTGADDKTALVWDTETWEATTVLTDPDAGAIYALAYSPDGHWIATGHTDNNVRLWKTEEILEHEGQTPPHATLSGHDNHIYDLAFHPDSDVLASSSWDGFVYFWDTKTQERLDIVLDHHKTFVYAVAFSPNGQYMATGARDGVVRLWRLDNFPNRPPQLIAPLHAHTDIVWSVVFSPDGKYLASSSWDGTVRRYLVAFDDVWALAEQYLQIERRARGPEASP